MGYRTKSLSKRLSMALCALSALFFSPTSSRADECTEHAYIPQTERCLGFGMLMHLDILRRYIDLDLAREYRPNFYQIVVAPVGRDGAVSDSYVTTRTPQGMQREWYANFYVYVTPEYLAARNSYPSLIRLAAMRFCESQYLDFPFPSVEEKVYARREDIERCVYQNMLSEEDHYFTALEHEIGLGEQYLQQFKGLSGAVLRDTVRARLAPARNVLN